MFLLYIDASGVPELSGKPPQYAMVGACVHEGTWFALNRRVTTLKRRYSLDGADFELHAKDFCTIIAEQDEIIGFEQLDRVARRDAMVKARDAKIKRILDDNSKTPDQQKSTVAKLQTRYHHTSPFIHLTKEERACLLEDALDLVGSHEGIRLFGEVVEKSCLFQVTGENNAIQNTFVQLVSRFDAFLSRYNRDATTVSKGMLVMDDEPTYQKYLEKLFDTFRNHGHPWGVLQHVIETPFFIDSKRASGIQAVDLCSYALRRYVGSPSRKGSKEEENFLRVFHKFDRDGPRLHGLRHYCPKMNCDCIICEYRMPRPNHSHKENERPFHETPLSDTPPS